MTFLSLASVNDAVRVISLRDIRAEYGLTILEAARALDLAASAVEQLERDEGPDISPEQVRQKYELYAATNNSDARNLIFGHYPLRMARELLGLNIEQMAERYGYKTSSWKRIEANARPLRPGLLEEIEDQVRTRFTAICASAA